MTGRWMSECVSWSYCLPVAVLAESKEWESIQVLRSLVFHGTELVVAEPQHLSLTITCLDAIERAVRRLYLYPMSERP
jgi:hypothetical protein